MLEVNNFYFLLLMIFDDLNKMYNMLQLIWYKDVNQSIFY